MKRLIPFATLIAAVLLPHPAAAAVSAAIGGYAQDKPSKSGAALILSSGESVPRVPLEVQGSLLAPIVSGGGYAATAEVRGFTGGGYGGAFVGAGVGLGDLSQDRSAGTVFTAFAGKSVAPLTSIEIRLYKQTRSGGATAGFVGLRLSF